MGFLHLTRDQLWLQARFPSDHACDVLNDPTDLAHEMVVPTGIVLVPCTTGANGYHAYQAVADQGGEDIVDGGAGQGGLPLVQ